MTFILGFGAMVLVGPRRDHARSTRAATWRRRCSPKLLGGTPFLGFIAAVAFATILAVVAGLTLSGAAALSHDLWVTSCATARPSEREQLRVARVATVVLGVVAIVLGISFKGQNVAFMVGLAFAIAASANFPALCCRSSGAASRRRRPAQHGRRHGVEPAPHRALADDPVDLPRTTAASSRSRNPAIVTIPLSFAVAIVTTVLCPEPDSARRYAEVAERVASCDRISDPAPDTWGGRCW